MPLTFSVLEELNTLSPWQYQTATTSFPSSRVQRSCHLLLRASPAAVLEAPLTGAGGLDTSGEKMEFGLLVGPTGVGIVPSPPEPASQLRPTAEKHEASRQNVFESG